MYRQLLHFGLLIPALFVTALVPRKSASLPSSVTSTATASEISTVNTTDRMSLVGGDTTPGTRPSNSSEVSSGDVNEVVPWKYGLIVCFSAPRNPRNMGYERLIAVLRTAAAQAALQPASSYPPAGTSFLSRSGTDGFAFRNIYLYMRYATHLTYGDIHEFIIHVLLLRVRFRQATGLYLTEFSWDIKQTYPPEIWPIAEGLVSPLS